MPKGCPNSQIDYYRKALAVSESAAGPEAALTGTILGNWAWLAHERGLVDEAKFRYQQALVIQQQTLGRDHPRIAMLCERYAALLHGLGQSAEANLFAARAATIRVHQTQSSRSPEQNQPNVTSLEAQKG